MSQSTPTEEIQIRAEQWRILSFVGPGRTVYEVLSSSSLPAIDTLRTLGQLVDGQLLSVDLPHDHVSEPPPAAAPDVPWEPVAEPGPEPADAYPPPPEPERAAAAGRHQPASAAPQPGIMPPPITGDPWSTPSQMAGSRRNPALRPVDRPAVGDQTSVPDLGARVRPLRHLLRARRRPPLPAPLPGGGRRPRDSGPAAPGPAAPAPPAHPPGRRARPPPGRGRRPAGRPLPDRGRLAPQAVRAGDRRPVPGVRPLLRTPRRPAGRDAGDPLHPDQRGRPVHRPRPGPGRGGPAGGRAAARCSTWARPPG